MDEPRYIDDPFDDRDLSIEGQGFLDPELCLYVFDTIGRTKHQFKTDAEVAKWRRVDKAFDKDEIPISWINDRLEYAKKYRWSLTTLAGSILNHPNMQAWMIKNKVQLDSVARKEQNDEPARKP